MEIIRETNQLVKAQQNAEQAKQTSEIKEMLNFLLQGEPQKEEDFWVITPVMLKQIGQRDEKMITWLLIMIMILR